MTDDRHDGDDYLIVPFPNPADLEAWLDKHHTTEPGLWIKFAKKGRGIPSITLPEAIEVACCFGWVDSKMHRWDDDYYVLRFQPRRARSNWTEGNATKALTLIAAGRMRPAGFAAIELARSNGRWPLP
jgi:uncharacterized protein YdeI (YjbR/CyaY-like superfamily)